MNASGSNVSTADLRRIDLAFCWPINDETTPEEGLARLKSCGFDGIELWPQPLEKFGAPRWADALRATGMRCVQLCPYFDFVHGPERLEKSRRDLRTFLEAATTTDCKRLRVFTGPPWGEGVVGAAQATAAQWQAATDGLREFCGVAAEEGVELCLECHEGSLMEDAPSALRLLRGVDRPNLTVNLQIPFLHEDWSVSLDKLAAHTTHIHIHNWTDGPGVGDLTFLSEGSFDWWPLLRRLQRETAYDALCLSVEHVEHNGKHSPWETARRDGPYLVNLRARLARPVKNFPPMACRPRDGEHMEAFELLYAQGVRVFQVDATFAEDIFHPVLRAWPSREVFDYSAQETYWEELLSRCPEARLCLRLYAGSPPWWDAAHPGELQRYADGSVDHHFQRSERTTLPSLASEIWLEDSAHALSHFLRWLQGSRWAGKIWGFMLGYGITWEWGILGSDAFPDYSAPMEQRFRRWLRDHYADEETLRRVWSDEQVSFATARVPTRAERERHNGGFREFPRDRPSFDFQRCLSDANVDYLLSLARVVRSETGDAYALGAFYGYCFTAREQTAFTGCYGAGGLQGGHHALARVQAAGLVDFLASPYAYGNRDLGEGLLVQHFPLRGAQEHGLHGYDENDLYTFLVDSEGDERTISIGATRTLEDSVAHQRLALMSSLGRGSSSWWMELTEWVGPYASNYNHPELLAELGRHTAIFHGASPARSCAEIAILLDERAVAALGLASTLLRDEIYQQLPAWAWCGAPFDLWLASDASAESMRPYKLVYVFSPYLASAARENLRLALCHSGRTVWWAPGTGSLADHGRDAEAFRQLTGFDEPEKIESLRRADRDGWVSLYGPCAGLTARDLAAIASKAGVHLFGEAPLQVLTAGNWTAIHARQEGELDLVFPGATKRQERFGGKAVQGSTVRFPFDRQRMALFYEDR